MQLVLGGAAPRRSLLARIIARLATPPPPPRRHFAKAWGRRPLPPGRAAGRRRTVA